MRCPDCGYIMGESYYYPKYILGLIVCCPKCKKEFEIKFKEDDFFAKGRCYERNSGLGLWKEVGE